MEACAITGFQHQEVVVFRTLPSHPSTRASAAKWRFQKYPLWRAFFKRCVFDDRFLPCGRYSKLERKYLCFQTKTDTCERGLYLRYYTQFCKSTHSHVPPNFCHVGRCNQCDKVIISIGRRTVFEMQQFLRRSCV